MIVFTTAYDEYAVRAFTVNSIDYLLKPIHEERLLQAIRRFEGLTKKNIHDFNSESRMMEVLRSFLLHRKLYRRRIKSIVRGF